MQVSFHGGAREVTGSCHLVEAAGKKVLIDCGMFQGGRRLEEDNADEFGFVPESVDLLLLTHAHLDHCGRLPLLYKRGFRGEIVTTAASRELARVVLLDSAHLQVEEAEHLSAKRVRRGDAPVEPLYQVLDALNTFELFGRAPAYGDPVALAPGLTATFLDAGHILGSATVVIESEENGTRRRIALSGDIGNADRPLLRPPATPDGADAVVMETTYGDRLHRTLDDSIEELWQVVAGTVARGGNVVIPTFALERTQEVLFFLRVGVEQGRLPESLPVFLDSPMAISATEIYRRHPEGYDDDVAELFRSGKDPFALPRLTFTRTTEQSKALNAMPGGKVIMAGSGMATGGRVLHHLKHNLWRTEASVVLVGFAAYGTLARLLVDGAETVKLFGDEIPVRAPIHTINGFSAHADRDELLAWHRAIDPDRTFLVHGEEKAMESFARSLDAPQVTLPERGEVFTL